MKKSILITLFVILLSLTLVGTALAKSGVVVVKGQVTAIDEVSISVKSVLSVEPFVFTLPDEFDASTVNVDDTVMVRGTEQQDGTLKAITIRLLVGKGQGQGGGKPEVTGKANSAFCSEDKQEKLHPMFEKLAEKYEAEGINPEWVMNYYCGGQSIGAIMLALKTASLQEEGVFIETAAGLLELRAGGQSWGKIWQELKMIGSEEAVNTPPGQLKKNNK